MNEWISTAFNESLYEKFEEKMVTFIQLISFSFTLMSLKSVKALILALNSRFRKMCLLKYSTEKYVEEKIFFLLLVGISFFYYTLEVLLNALIL